MRRGRIPEAYFPVILQTPLKYNYKHFAETSSSHDMKRWRSPDSVTHIVKMALREAGNGDFHLHRLRHSFAVLFIEAGGGLRVLQDLLGHRHYRTTETYAHVHGDHLQEAVNMVKIPSVLRVVK
jgi:site-specific recombinase XerD